MRRIRPRRSPAVPLLIAVLAGAVAVLWLWWANTPSLADTNAKILNAGRITGLLAGYLMALVVLQMARVPALERRVGSDRVARWHAMSGRYTISLVLAHVVLTMYGYALQAGKGFGDIVQQTVDSVGQLPDLGKATIGTGLLVLIALLSMGPVRRRIPYDFWYHVHLLTYAVVFLTFWHQLSTGNDFVVEPTAKTFWYALYGSVTALVLWYRILTPLRLNLRHRMRVEAVIEETPGVVSVLITGRRLHRIGAEPGQFFRWRFLAPGMRFSSHPYSLSAAPRPNMLRITVKAIGDHSSALRGLRPGTRVWAEGPYGALTAQRRSRGKVLLVAGGVGITPMRALFETLPGAAGDLTLLYRANTTQDLALWDELAQIAQERGARLMYAVNSPEGERPDISADTLRRKLPDIDRHDVFMCGPPGFAQQVYEALRGAGVPARRIHHESFEM
ncbi:MULTISPECIES: ferredoxin reductase family protein [Streptomyces]|nr:MULTISPECIES: ferredoxin reductase family protein [Streptomyces]MBA5221455.1 ferredoxin reductase family protein [Streptomyces griseoaurantiacus]MDX3087849.1 ferredoxin reductase family protein [Streptomyces sp. ME12-02E]MDX3331206.1 ferredoxin reductase family protein [Streptomyces sp. ME02-6978a]MDX3360124.1 ferredoxin reductase family protein [Streptomyces sp. ME02-6978.2a]WTI30813.1 ferredoxin reductase family protein [Streptomyces jietaisiensis]